MSQFPSILCGVLGLGLLRVAQGQTPVASQSSGPAVAIVNVAVFPMDSDRVLRGQTVVLQDGVITQLGPATRITIPSGAAQIDGTGKYLIPGLVDVHIHLSSNPEDEQRRLLRLFLSQGVTTVLNLRGTPQLLELREKVATGRVLGPRIYTVGPYVNEPFVTTPDEVERAVVEQQRAGYDFVKLHGDLSLEAYRRLMSVARRVGIRVIGHAPRNLGVEVMFEERQYAVAHGEEFLYDRQNRSTDASLPDVRARIPEFARGMADARIWLMPNLTAYKAIAGQIWNLDSMLARPEMRYLPRSVREGWGPATNPYTRRFPPSFYPGIMARYKVIEELVRAFQASGVPMLVGTDAMNAGVVPGFSTHDELADLVAAGLSPYQALRAATANAAEFFGTTDRSGTIAVGKAADLVLLDANPLGDIKNSRRIAAVILHGKLLSREQLSAP